MLHLCFRQPHLPPQRSRHRLKVKVPPHLRAHQDLQGMKNLQQRPERRKRRTEQPGKSHREKIEFHSYWEILFAPSDKRLQREERDGQQKDNKRTGNAKSKSSSSSSSDRPQMKQDKFGFYCNPPPQDKTPSPKGKRTRHKFCLVHHWERPSFTT